MASEPNRNSALVWCPLVPFDDLVELAGHENELEKINQVYDDWRSSMRGRSNVVDDAGIFLDRIRLLWISVGIACGVKRALAERVQTIIGEQLRKSALAFVSRMPTKSSDEAAVRQTLAAFFQQLRFGRDIFPLEEMQKTVVIPDQFKELRESPLSHKTRRASNKEKGMADEQVVSNALAESVGILGRLYIHLLSPDPWGTE